MVCGTIPRQVVQGFMRKLAKYGSVSEPASNILS